MQYVEPPAPPASCYWKYLQIMATWYEASVGFTSVCRSAVVQILSDVLLLFDTICKRAVMFARNCLNSSSDVVRYVANYVSILAGWLQEVDGKIFLDVKISHCL